MIGKRTRLSFFFLPITIPNTCKTNTTQHNFHVPKFSPDWQVVLVTSVTTETKWKPSSGNRLQKHNVTYDSAAPRYTILIIAGKSLPSADGI